MNLLRNFVISALLVASCSTPRAVQEYQRDTIVTTIREIETVHDTVLMVQLPEGSDSAVLPDSDTSVLRTSLAESEAWVADGELHHTLRNREALLPVNVKLPKYIYTRNDSIIRDRQAVEQVEIERQLSKWQRFVMALGYGLLLSLLLWAAKTLGKYFI